MLTLGLGKKKKSFSRRSKSGRVRSLRLGSSRGSRGSKRKTVSRASRSNMAKESAVKKVDIDQLPLTLQFKTKTRMSLSGGYTPNKLGLRSRVLRDSGSSPSLKTQSPQRRKKKKSPKKRNSKSSGSGSGSSGQGYDSALKLKVLDVLNRPSLHASYVSDIENKASGKSCKTHDPCFVAAGTYANAYKTCLKNKCFLFKVRKPKRQFDINEYLINMEGYKKLVRLEKIPLIAQPYGVLGSSTDPLAYVYAFEENSEVLGKFLEFVNFTENEFRAIIFQVATVLAHLQNALPGFTHNDLHTDNVLVITHSKEQVFNYKSLKFKSKYSIRIIDFGQASTNAKQTRDAVSIWGSTLGNTMIDFLRLANWILLRLYKKLKFSTSKELRSTTSNFLILLSAYVSKDCVKNGGDSRDNSLTGKFLSVPWLSVNKIGQKYINSLYSQDKKNAMEQVLQNEYFNA